LGHKPVAEETQLPAAGEKYFFISSLAKGMKVLELIIDNEELSVSAVAQHLGLNRAGSHRFLSTLKDLGYVEKSEQNQYRATFKILGLAMKVANRFEIRRLALPFMQELSSAFRETVNLGFWDGKGILHLDKVESREILRMDTPIGSHAPAYCTALGKAILAHLPVYDLNIYLSTIKLKPQGPNTIASKKLLREEIEKIRQTGYAVDDEELAPGLRCVAAPVFDHTGRANYAISVSGPSMRMTNERIETIRPRLRNVCAKLSEQLGEPARQLPVAQSKPSSLRKES
jgi:DNA-binding IclR family transcriptional regulator